MFAQEALVLQKHSNSRQSSYSLMRYLKFREALGTKFFSHENVLKFSKKWVFFPEVSVSPNEKDVHFYARLRWGGTLWASVQCAS